MEDHDGMHHHWRVKGRLRVRLELYFVMEATLYHSDDYILAQPSRVPKALNLHES